jgi:hypothetical protein
MKSKFKIGDVIAVFDEEARGTIITEPRIDRVNFNGRVYAMLDCYVLGVDGGIRFWGFVADETIKVI